MAAGGLTGAPPASAAEARLPLPPPAQSGLDHIVVLCMENRSFDHYLGWVPNSDGRQAGLTYFDEAGMPHETHRLLEWTGCGFNDPSHSYLGGRVQLNGGACDGFRRGRNDDYALGYYQRPDLPTMSQLVSNFTTCDRWFAGILGPTYPNRFYTHSAGTDRVRNTFAVCKLPTIWDRLAAADIPATYYFSDLPVLALYGGKYGSISQPIATFFEDAAAGRLPAYAYVDPSFIGSTQNDDHPHADIRRGQHLIGRVVKALTESPQWGNSLLIITYDEWGGFFDHVPPPRFPDDVDNPGATTPDHGQAGFRVPGLLVSPFARPGKVTHIPFEHSAIPKLVEWRYGLAPLTKRDRASKNLARALDFRGPNLVPPTITVPPDPGPDPCGDGAGAAVQDSSWTELAASPHLRAYGVGPA